LQGRLSEANPTVLRKIMVEYITVGFAPLDLPGGKSNHLPMVFAGGRSSGVLP
jgi:hypothetical protein